MSKGLFDTLKIWLAPKKVPKKSQKRLAFPKIQWYTINNLW